MTQIWVTDEINKLLDAELTSGEKKEGLLHCILTLALTDKQFMSRAKSLNQYLKNEGATNLEKRWL